MKRHFYITCLLFICGLPQSDAQTRQSEIQSGYSGGFNEQVQQPEGSVSLIVLGDWGRSGQYHQAAVAGQMGKVAATLNAAFIVSTGDNFYPSGVQSVQDPQWQYSYEAVYRSHFLQNNWYAALGNHDYKGNIQAQIAYSQVSRRWKMPAAYYSEKIRLKNGDLLLLVVIDTTPLLDGYYQPDNECFENVQRQDTAAQRRWLVQTLSDTDSHIRWRIVAGHHPLYSGGKRKNSDDTRQLRQRLEPLMEQYKVDFYLCGHEHDLQIIQPEQGGFIQLLSGSGSETRPTGNTDGTLFCAAAPGFLTISLRHDEALIQAVHANGQLLYTMPVRK